MLSDHEQRELREFEASITANDPHFARALQQRQQHMAGCRWTRHADRIVVILACVLGFGALLAGSFSSAVALVTATLLAWVMWHSTSAGDTGTTGGPEPR